MLGNRTIRSSIGAAFQVRHYRAARNMLLRYGRPLDGFKRYLLGSGHYPTEIAIKTPLGIITPAIYSPHDMLTVNEIFCREDYVCPADVQIIVDFGSNIGISALYFLTRNKESFAYLFEPLPANVEKLRNNLRAHEGRFELSSLAVSLSDGEVEFGYEETGRYGGIGLRRQKNMQVQCRAANDLLKGILERHSVIDVLKIDTESLEKEILLGIPFDTLQRIRYVFIEQLFDHNPIASTHDYAQYGGVARFRWKLPGSIVGIQR